MNRLLKQSLYILLVISMIFNFSIAKDQVVIKIASWLPRDHVINSIFWTNFIKDIEKTTDGRVTAKVEYNLASVPELLGLVEDDGADISWVFNGYTPGRFVTSKLIELPGLKGNSEAASVAYWRTYEKYLKKADEYKGVTVIGLTVHTEAYLLMDEKINSLKDLKGKKLRLPGGVGTDVGKSLGAVPVLVPAPKIYETISNRIADGVMLPADLFGALKLSEVAPHGYGIPGGFYRGSFAIIMNNNLLSKLSDKDKAALLALTGEPLSKAIGSTWDIGDKRGMAEYKKAATITPLGNDDIKYFDTKTKDIQKSVIAEVDKRGVNGQAAFDMIKQIMATYKD